MFHQFETKTCPKCDALITPQLHYCRQCKAYLHGTALEGWIFKNLLGGFMSGAPGTALLCLLIVLYYALMTMLAGFDSFLGFSSFSLQQLGATHGPSILRGQYWRFVTSIFGHHDLLHLALNLWCLVTAGPLVERIFDRKKMLIIYLLAGTLSMVCSHVWYVLINGGSSIAVVSAGASGAVCGMIGAAWFGARKLGIDGKETAGAMKRWAILMLVWGLFVPGINNAAHFGGFAVGAALAQIIPIGLTQRVFTQRILSVVFLAMLTGLFACGGFMIQNLNGTPVSFSDDAHPRTIFGKVYAPGTEFDYSAQQRVWKKCQDLLNKRSDPQETLKTCDINMRLNARSPHSFEFMARAQEQVEKREEATLMRNIAQAMQDR
jgi:membrane associated rhomboid family serine protease